MNAGRLTWQLPALLLLSLPLWQGAMSRFLTLDPGAITAPLHQDSSFLLEEVLFDQTSRGGAGQSPPEFDSVQSPPQLAGDEEVTLRARRVHGNDQGSGFTLEGADATRLGPRPLHISGGQAFFDPDRQILTLLDAVVVETADLVVRTPALRYLAKFETIKSAAEVEMTGKGMTLSGTSFMYNLQNGDLRVGERVRFHFTPALPRQGQNNTPEGTPATGQAP